jgi:hypothetical protein
MRISALWDELEAEAAAGSSGAWLSRFALPQTGHPILVALEVSTRRRALLLPLNPAAMPPRHDWPQCRGLELFAVTISGTPNIGVRLTDPQYADVFTALAEDVAPRVSAATNDREAGLALLDRLRRWQKFLTAKSSELSVSRQRGLFGELHLLRQWLLPSFGLETPVQCWRAPHAAHQDFQFPGGAIEVKTTAAKQPNAVQITSERQLDDTGVRALYLFVVILDEREIEDTAATVGETLPEIVSSLRRTLDIRPVIRGIFDDRLLDAGYLDSDAARFDSRRYSFRSERCFHVRNGFPRILEGQLPSGIGDVSYALALAACESFAVDVPDMLSTIQMTG